MPPEDDKKKSKETDDSKDDKKKEPEISMSDVVKAIQILSGQVRAMGTTVKGIQDGSVEIRARAPRREPEPKKSEKKDLEAMLDYQIKGNLEYRYLDEINLKIYMSEKEVGILSLPKIDGEVDMMGFISTDARFHKWCSDLFDYYWDRSITKTTSWLQEALG